MSHSDKKFKQGIISGKITAVIRPCNNDSLKAGVYYHRMTGNNNPLNHWWKMSTPERELILVSPGGVVLMYRVLFIMRHIERAGLMVESGGTLSPLEDHQVSELARLNGFDTIESFYTWFEVKYGRELYTRYFWVIKW